MAREIALQNPAARLDIRLPAAGPAGGPLTGLLPSPPKREFGPPGLRRFLRRSAGGEVKAVPPALFAPAANVAASLTVPADRFSVPILVPLDERASPATQSAAEPSEEASRARRGTLLRPKTMRLFDWTLLGVEVAAALIVAWLAAQYVYTAYVDTGPHHSAVVVTATQTPGTRQVAKPTSTIRSAVRATPTYFAEVAPPLVGSPAGSGTGVLSGVAVPTATGTATLTPTPTVDPVLLLPVRLRIPVMVLDSPVHEVHVNFGTWEVSEMLIGHHEGTAGPGQQGNMVLAGHRDINSALFRDLDRLKPGDRVYVSNSLREYRYVVTGSEVVSPAATDVMDPTDDSRLTLITCTPIGLATQRLVVTAQLDTSYTDKTATGAQNTP